MQLLMAHCLSWLILGHEQHGAFTVLVFEVATAGGVTLIGIEMGLALLDGVGSGVAGRSTLSAS